MNSRSNIRVRVMLWAAFLAFIFQLAAAAAPAVRVTIQIDDNNLKVGETTTAHIMAQIVPDQAATTTQIFSWYVDLLNSAPGAVQIEASSIDVSTSDSNPNTSSKGVFSTGQLRTIYDSFIGMPGAGHDAPIELFSVQLKAIAVGSASISVAAGTGAQALEEDFIVSTTMGDPVFGGLYSTASAQVSTFNNVPPTIDPIANISVNEGSQMSVTAVGHDADQGQTLTYALLGTPPSGVVLNPTTGLLTWTPTENQGPAIYTFRVRVADNGAPALFATNQFDIVVAEVNNAPTLQVPATITRAELQAISATCTATDTDFLLGKTPTTNRLTFSLIEPPLGTAINATTGAFTWTPTEEEGPGSYVITVEVVDDGVPPRGDRKIFTINITEVNRAPTIVSPGDQTLAEGATLNVAFVGSDLDIPQNPLTYSLVENPPGVILDPGTGLVTWTPTEAQGPGTYTIRVAVSDNAPSPLRSTNVMQVTVVENNSAPSLAPLADRTVTELTSLTFTATATDADLPAQTRTFSLDSPPAGASINATSGVFTWTPTEAQGPGQYTIVVRVTDNGSPARSDTKSFDVTVNEQNAAPVVTVPAGQSTPTIAELSLLSVQFTATDSDLPANLLTFTLAGGPSGIELNGASGLLLWTPSEGQGPGTYPVKVVATDNGTPPLSTTNTITVTVTEANRPPVIDPIPDQIIAEQSKLTVPVVANDLDLPPQTLLYSLDSPPAGAAIDAAGVFTWTPTEAQGPGQYTITVRVRESGAGGLAVTRAFGVTVNEVNSAPTVLDATLTRAEMTAILYQPNLSDPDVLNGQTPNVNRFTYGILDAPEGAAINPQTGAFSWTPTEEQGPGTFQIRVVSTDNGVPPLSTTSTLTVNVTEANRAPSITAPANQTIAELTTLSATFTATDPDVPANTLSFVLIQAPQGVQLNPLTGTITWTPTEAQGPGTYPIRVAVSDGASPALRATNTVTITVTESNSPPVLAAIPDYILNAGSTINFTASATDPDMPTQTVAFSLVSAPSGASVNPSTGVFQWTPTTAQAAQQHTVVMRVTESGAAGLSDSKTFRVMVTMPPNTAPRIFSPSDQTVAVGATLNVANVAFDTDVPANTLTFAIVSAPAGATISPSTGVLTWTPTAAQVGKVQVQVKVTDDGSPSLSATNSFFVTATALANTAPVIASPGDKTVAVGATLTVTNVAVDADVPANVLTFAIVTGPSGMTINANTGVLTWTPTAAQVGTVQVQIKVTDNGSPPLSATNSFSVTVTGSSGQPATLRVISVLTEGVSLRVEGTANASYDIEFSTDLINWSPLTTVALGNQTFSTYLDTTHGFGQQRGFYRAKSGGASGNPTAPTVLPQAVGSGGFTLRVTGDAGFTYRVEFSVDLINWTPLGSVSITTGTSADYIDTAQPTRGTRGFYRAVFP